MRAKLMIKNPSRVEDHWTAEVKQATRRETGVNPRLLKAFPESPARLLPRAHGLRAMAGLVRRAGSPHA